MEKHPSKHELLDMISLDDIGEEMRELADMIGLPSFIELVKYAGGDSLYIPHPDRLILNVRNKLIIAEFDGGNRKELARKWNMSVRNIHKITRQYREGKANGKQ